MQCRKKWNKHKRKVKYVNDSDTMYSSKLKQQEPMVNFRYRVNTIRDSIVEESRTLFLGKA